MIPDKLGCSSETGNLLDYIRIVETILLPDFDDYKYNSNITFKPVDIKNRVEIGKKKTIPLGLTICTSAFLERYDNNEIRLKPSYKEYVDNSTIQDLITVLGLDTDKFWLLILFAYDYCNTLFFQGKTMKLTPYEQIQELCDTINKAEPPMTLTFKSGKKKVVIDSPLAIRLIREMITNNSIDITDGLFRELNKRTEQENPDTLTVSPFIAFFAQILLRFFDTQQQVRAKRKKGANHSFKETDLVCQLIHFTKLSINKRWLELENETLKAFLKQYRSYEYPNNVSSVYPEFLL